MQRLASWKAAFQALFHQAVLHPLPHLHALLCDAYYTPNLDVMQMPETPVQQVCFSRRALAYLLSVKTA